jgi:hypothetical protein
MRDFYVDYMVDSYRRGDQFEEARAYRQIKNIRGHTSSALKFPGQIYPHILERLGTLLVEWGDHLLCRYQELVTAN